MHAAIHMRILARAGTNTIVEESSQTTEQQDADRSSFRLKEVFKVNPNEVMQLPVGEAYVIAHGEAQRVRVLPVSVDPKVLEEVSTSLTSILVPSITSHSVNQIRMSTHNDNMTGELEALSNETHDKQDEDFLK